MTSLNLNLPRCFICLDFIGEDFQLYTEDFICSYKCKNKYIEIKAQEIVNKSFNEVVGKNDYRTDYHEHYKIIYAFAIGCINKTLKNSNQERKD